MRVIVVIAIMAAIVAIEPDRRSAHAQERPESPAGQPAQATASATDYAIEPFDRTMELTTNANVRAGPSKRYEVLEVAAIGERVRVTGKVKDRNWVQVERPQGEIYDVAFIYAPLLRDPQPSSHGEPGRGGEQSDQNTKPVADRQLNPDLRVSELVKSASAGLKSERRASLLTIAESADPAVDDDVEPPSEHSEAPSGLKATLAEGDDDQAFLYTALTEESEPTTLSRPRGPGWSIVENQGCEVWNYGNRDYEPFTWFGDCVEGRASGEGALVFLGGEGVYEGGMRSGKPHGYGVLTWSNGFRYEGELYQGMQHGTGTLIRANGERYEGGWREGKPHGRGTYTAAGGETYEGAWRDGCFSDQDGRRAWLGTEGSACGFDPSYPQTQQQQQ